MLSKFVSQVATGFHGVPDDILKQADGFTAICIFVNKRIQPGQIDILKANGNKVILCCSAGYENTEHHLLLSSELILVKFAFTGLSRYNTVMGTNNTLFQ